jgi:hypothetical protein
MKLRKSEIAWGVFFGSVAAWSFDSVAVQLLFVFTAAPLCAIAEALLLGGGE